jgi:hypothetical protein
MRLTARRPSNSGRYCCPILANIETCRQNLVELTNIQDHVNLTSGPRVVTRGQIYGDVALLLGSGGGGLLRVRSLTRKKIEIEQIG